MAPYTFILITELFETEKKHVRKLQILRALFAEPLDGILSTELSEKLFSNLDDIITFHEKFNARMIAKVDDEPPSLEVGDVLSFMVTFA